MADPQYLILGEILRPHSIKGELRMRILTDFPERITQRKHVFLGADADSPRVKGYDVEHMRMHQGYGLLKLKTIDDRNQAEMLRGLLVLVKLEDAVPLEEDEVYLYQLIGLNVFLEDGTALGTLVEVLETGANDVYIIDSPQHGEVLIPAIDETILDTDLENQRITVRLPDGLLPS
ncbi:MAG: ribosome maturation factor RimM [Anaerolineae bacterium]